jgi:TonB-linked SusC/RagA family outer membrane protein
MKRILLLSFMLCFTLFGQVLAQDRTVSGKVTSAEDGSTLPGVNVIIKGTSRGVTTDIDGNFTISVPSAGGTLVFSFIGLTSEEVEIGSKARIDLKMRADVKTLGEIIITGVATGTPQKKLTFSVGKVNEDLIQQVPAVNPGTALQGKVAGVRVRSGGGTPGGAPDILLRGATSLVTSSAPLIIVDGVLTEGSLADINAEDIESMEVVKGAAAASLYGSRAANGVINIITRRGSRLAKGETIVKVRSEVGQSFLEHRPAKTRHHAFLLSDGTDQRTDGYTGEVTFIPSGYPNPARLNPTGVMETPFPFIEDHFGQVFKPQTFNTNYGSVSSNLGNTQFLASYQYTDQQGIIELANGNQRNNFRINLDHQPNDKIKISSSTLFSRSTTDLNGAAAGGGARNPMYSLMFLDPHARILEPNADGTPYKWNPNVLSLEPNPLYALNNRQWTGNNMRFLGNYKVSYMPVSWATVDAEYGLDRINYLENRYTPKGYLDIAAVAQARLGEVYRYTSNRTAQTLSLTGSIIKSFGDFNTRTRVQYMYEDNQGERFEALGQDLKVAGINNLNNANQDNLSVWSANDQIVAKNYSAIFAADYKDKYIFDALIRRDGVSLFGAEQRWQTFYRVSGAYRISEDVKIPGIQELKIRSSYGVSGLRPPFAAQYEVINLTNGNIGVPLTIGNPMLQPAFNKEFESGLDVNFLNRFNFQFSYARSNNEGQILQVPQSAASGFRNQWMNAGTLETNVFEFTLGANLVKSSAFTWDINIVADRIRSKITSLDRPGFNVGPDNAFFIQEGETFGIFYGRKWARSLEDVKNQVPEGRDVNDIFVVNNHGYVVRRAQIGTTAEVPILMTDDEGQILQTKIGDINPDFNLGFANTFRFKGLSMFVLFDWQQGGQVYNQTRQWLVRDGLAGEMDAGRLPNNQRKSNAYWQALYNQNNINSHFVEDATFVKLRELSFNYSFGKNIFESAGLRFVRDVKIGVVGRNLLTLTKYSGFDPEVGTSQGGVGANIYRWDSFGYPNFRTFSGSIEITF